MNQKKVTLEVGDVIYVEYYSTVNARNTIARVTPTLAMTKNGTRFKREYTEGCQISPYPYSPYSRFSYYIATPEMETRFQKAKMRAAVRAIKVDNLGDDTLKQIYGIITTPNPKERE